MNPGYTAPNYLLPLGHRGSCVSGKTCGADPALRETNLLGGRDGCERIVAVARTKPCWREPSAFLEPARHDAAARAV